MPIKEKSNFTPDLALIGILTIIFAINAWKSASAIPILAIGEPALTGFLLLSVFTLDIPIVPLLMGALPLLCSLFWLSKARSESQHASVKLLAWIGFSVSIISAAIF